MSTMLCADVARRATRSEQRDIPDMLQSWSCTATPVPALPPLLEQLSTYQHPDSKLFLKHIRAFNSNLAFTSIGVCEEDVTFAPGAPCYVISGEMHHLIGSLLPQDQHQGRFAQLYLYDAQEAAVSRSAYLMRVVQDRSLRMPRLLDSLANLLGVCNPYVRVLRSASERLSQTPSEELHVRLLAARQGQTAGTHNLPASDEIAVILPGSGDDNAVGDRDIVLQYRSSRLKRLPFLHPAYNALHYPLLFPHGEDGWCIGIPLVGATQGPEDGDATYFQVEGDDRQPDPSGEQHAGRVSRRRTTVSLLQYTSYRLMIREDSHMHRFQRLFLQFVVDNYARIEAQRLLYIRTHQDDLRAESYRGLCDALDVDGAVSYASGGRRIVLPSSFHGSPRHMHEQYQDAMAIIRKYMKPDLFITMTCNSSWPEIRENLLPQQTAADRPDLCVRVFYLKLQALLCDLLKNHVLGQVLAYVWVIEFQKRGLPHAHILLILRDEDKPRTVDDYDRYVSAEIPDAEVYPQLYDMVTTCMLHGPCEGRCLNEDGVCSKGFPKPFQGQTDDNEDGYPLYRRRDNGVTVQRNGAVFTNQHVVPYNRFLTQKYNCHLNVEICSSIKSVKYLFKYVHKGHDRTNRALSSPESQPIDEVERFATGRYVSQCEALHRIFQFKLHDRSPAVQRLAVHEEDMQTVILPSSTVVRQVPLTQTTLTAYFQLNASDPTARTILYHDIPTFYSWDKLTTRWVRRTRQLRTPTIGRMYFVSPTDTERFCLRLLLTRVPGATSFAHLRTVNGEAFDTFGAACIAQGLLHDDSEWYHCMQEACDSIANGKHLRALFATILLFGNVAEPWRLWEAFQDHLTADIIFNRRIHNPGATLSDRDISVALREVEADLQLVGKSLASFPGLDVPHTTEDPTFHSNDEHQDDSYGYQLLNSDQRQIFDYVHQAYTRPLGHPGNLIYVDGPGGTGKTFLYNTIIKSLNARGAHAVVVSSSGFSAILLRGGRTAHSVFKIPISGLAHDSVCSLSVNTKMAALIRSSAITIWDEVGVIHRYCIEAVDRLYRDIMRTVDASSLSLPFDGKVMLLGGDFKHVLPVIPRASRAHIVLSTLPHSPLWSKFKVMRLTVNMRINRLLQEGRDATTMTNFANLLLRVGTAAEPCGEDNAYVELPANICIFPGPTHSDNITRIIDATFPDFVNNVTNEHFLVHRAILAAKNDVVDEINRHMLDKLPGVTTTLRSTDTLCDDSGRGSSMYPTEFLNSLAPSGLPPHLLKLKTGMPVLLMRNLRPAAGLCNGVRMIVRHVGARVVTCEIAVGDHAGSTALIPRVITCPSDDTYPFPFQRLQFPLQPAFALTINESQGQTLSFVGLMLTPPVFAHGQLYVAMSRVGSPENIRILTEKDQRGRFVAKNVVYREALI